MTARNELQIVPFVVSVAGCDSIEAAVAEGCLIENIVHHNVLLLYDASKKTRDLLICTHHILHDQIAFFSLPHDSVI